MKKFIPLVAILTALVSCRENEDLMLTESALKKENKTKELYVYEKDQSKRDTIDTVTDNEPPVKDGNHWKAINDIED